MASHRTPYPSAADSLAWSRGLSASLSSLSSPAPSGRHAASVHISKTYRQASTLFLTRRLPEALSTVLPLVSPPSAEEQQQQQQQQQHQREKKGEEKEDGAEGGGQRQDGSFEPAPVARASRSSRVKVWSLYLTILNAIIELGPDEGKEAFGTQGWRAICHKVREGLVWEEVVRNGYHGVEGDVDADVVINLATLLLAHAKTQHLNQKRLENYLAAARTPNLDLSDRFPPGSGASSPRRHRSPPPSGGAATPRDLAARVKILELYTLHVLARNGEWEYAREFIAASPVLDEERREAFLQALESLREEQLAAARREEEERRRREDAIRRDIEEARRLRAENETRERRRLEEERERRAREAKEKERAGTAAAAAATEVDYGLERSPKSAAGAGAAGKDPARSVSPSSSSAASSSSGSKLTGCGSGGNGVVARPKKPLPPSRRRPTAAGRGSGASGGSGGNAATAPTFITRASMVLRNLRALIDEVAGSFETNPYVLYRTLTFIIGLLLLLSRKNIRERISRILSVSWAKVKATAGMGTKVSYI